MLQQRTKGSIDMDHAAQSWPAYTLSKRDKVVSDVLDFILNNACDGITVIDLLNEFSFSRRVLEHRFQKVLGKTPHQVIFSVRLNRVKLLLTETDLTLNLIADRSGFQHTEYLSVAFKREAGISPGQYRKLKKRTHAAAAD